VRRSGRHFAAGDCHEAALDLGEQAWRQRAVVGGFGVDIPQVRARIGATG
jgi:hypothetical protein